MSTRWLLAIAALLLAASISVVAAEDSDAVYYSVESVTYDIGTGMLHYEGIAQTADDTVTVSLTGNGTSVSKEEAVASQSYSGDMSVGILERGSYRLALNPLPSGSAAAIRDFPVDGLVKIGSASFDPDTMTVSFAGVTNRTSLEAILVMGGHSTSPVPVAVTNGSFSSVVPMDGYAPGAVILSVADSGFHDEAEVDVGSFVSLAAIGYDDGSGRLLWSGYSTGGTVSVELFDGSGRKVLGAFSAVSNGSFFGSVTRALANGTYVLRAVSVSDPSLSCERQLVVSSACVTADSGTDVSVYAGKSAQAHLSVENCSFSDVRVSVADSSVATASLDASAGVLTISGVSAGSTAVTASVGRSSVVFSVEVSVEPVVPVLRDYTFLLRMDMCADEADLGLSSYTAADLRSGIALSGTGYSAGEALEAILDDEGVPCEFWSGESGGQSLLYWVNQIFGLGDKHFDNGIWRYWIQYHDGVYNQLSLGHYTDGGSFSLIYGMTDVDGSEVRAVPVPAAPSLTYNGATQTAFRGEGYTATGASAKDAGSYVASLILDQGCAWDDCSFESKTVAWSIAPARLTAAYVSETVEEGSSPALAVTVTGFVGGESASTASGYKAPKVAAADLSVGSHTLKPSGGSAKNYTFRYVSGTLTVVPGGPAVGDSFSVGGLTYEVVSAGPTRVALTGYSDAPAALSVPACVSYGGVSFEVASIGQKAFYGCPSLVSVDTGGAAVGQKAFASCASLESVVVGADLRPYAFASCKSLSSVTVSEGVSSIGASAFSGCTGMERLSVAASVSSVGANAFYGLSFYDGDTRLDATAESLSGNDFAGSGKVLSLVHLAVGDVFVVDGLSYRVDSLSPAAVSLTGFEAPMSSLAVPDAVLYGGAALAVVSIGKEAFKGCASLVSADLGGVSEIGVKAFANCTKLKAVDVGDSLKTISAYAFYRCVRLADINIEDSAKTMRAIGSYAFYKCDSLLSIAVPSYMTTIGDEKPFPAEMADENGNPLGLSPDALKGYVYEKSDGKLKRQIGAELGHIYPAEKLSYKVIATLPLELEVCGHDESFRNITIPETAEFDGYAFKVTAIGDGAFKGYAKIRTVSMPSVERIGKEAFYGCTYVKPVDMDSVRSIGVKAFARCSSIGSVELGDSLKTISAYAFYACKSLGSIDIPDSVTSLGSYAFYKCESLQDVHLGDSLKKIGSRAFAYTAIESIEVPSKVSSIGSYAFYGCSALASVDMDGRSVEIGAGAFASCPSLGHVSMPDAIKKLGTGAFKGAVFKDASGKTLKHTAASLSGRIFEGSGGVLVSTS